MVSFTLNDILSATKGRYLRGGNPIFQGISTDTRKIKAGELFIPLVGQNFNGHDFIDEAIKRRAAGSLLQIPMNDKLQIPDKDRSFVFILVEDTLKALQEIAAFHRRRFHLEIIAITGSTGKTTCKEMIFSILSKNFRTLKSEANFNNIIGLPITLLQLQREHQMAVLELGMNLPGEIDTMATIAAPTMGVITNIGAAHLQFLGSIHGVREAKAELIPHIHPQGKLIFNADDPLTLDLANRAKCTVITFGLDSKADFQAYDIKSFGAKGHKFKLKTSSEEIDICLPIIGRHNILNALTAAAVTCNLGVNLKLIKESFINFHPVSGRLELVNVRDKITVLNDSYNANPKSMAEALLTLSQIKTQRRTIAVLGDMLELGDIAEEAHLRVGELVVKTGIDYLITVHSGAQKIAQGALQTGLNSHQIRSCSDWEEASHTLLQIIRPGDLILLKASRKIGLDNLLPFLMEI